MKSTAATVRQNREARKRLRLAVSRALTAYRQHSGDTLERLAEKLHLTSATAAKRMCDGTRTPEAITVSRIAKLCGVDVDALVNGKAKR